MKIAALAIYLPSFLSRYSIQLMLIALPWLMQRREASLPDISATLAFFYLGSITAAGLTGRLFAGRNLSRSLRVLMLILGLVSAATMFSEQSFVLYGLRIFQGLITGMLRPLNQIWLFSMIDRHASASVQARRAAISQVFIAFGTVLGAYFGARIGSIVSETWFTAVICAFPAFLGAMATPSSPHDMPEIKPGVELGGQLGIGLRFLLGTSGARYAVLAYLLNMALFKIWTVAYPMAVRDHGEAILAMLPTILTVAPLCFLMGQLCVALGSHYLANPRTATRALASSCVLQAWTLAWAIGHPQAWIAALIVCVSGGLLAALVYPAMQSILAADLKMTSPAVRSGVQLAVSLAADLGQVMGTAAVVMGTSMGLLPSTVLGISAMTLGPLVLRKAAVRLS